MRKQFESAILQHWGKKKVRSFAWWILLLSLSSIFCTESAGVSYVKGTCWGFGIYGISHQRLFTTFLSSTTWRRLFRREGIRIRSFASRWRYGLVPVGRRCVQCAGGNKREKCATSNKLDSTMRSLLCMCPIVSSFQMQSSLKSIKRL